MRREELLLAAVRRFTLEDGRLDNAVARRYGLSLAEMRALDYLQVSGGLTPGQLGERLQLTSGAVTALVDRLERRELVERTAHPTDRRSTLLRLTATTERFAMESYDEFKRDVTRAARRLSTEESETARRFLEELAEIAAEHAARQGQAAGEAGRTNA
jgi:DNA-binding MarR family transcriptional regulator